MPDPFQNARPYYDVTFPSSGDGFNLVAGFKNALQALAFMDMIPLQPRAHNPANTSIMVRGQDASSYFHPIYANDANERVTFSSGDTPAFSAPAANPRIDVVYLTPSGDIRVVTGTEAAAPTLPTLAPSGDTRMPICAVYLKPSQTKVVNYEDKDSNTGDGYIYQDLRPWLRYPRAQYPLPREVQLGDAATIVIDASASESFYAIIAGNRIIGIPQNPSRGRKFMLRLKASGADRTPTFQTGDQGFRYGSDIASVTAITQNKEDYYGMKYNEAARRWDIIGYLKGY